jgi:hypothetical protein
MKSENIAGFAEHPKSTPLSELRIIDGMAKRWKNRVTAKNCATVFWKNRKRIITAK